MSEERTPLHIAMTNLHRDFPWLGCMYDGESWRVYDMRRMPPHRVWPKGHTEQHQRDARNLHNPMAWKRMRTVLEAYDAERHE